MWQRLIWLVCSIVALFIILVWYTTTPRWVDSGQVAVVWTSDQQWTLGDADVHWDSQATQLLIHHNQTLVWASSPEQPWLNAAVARTDISDRAIERGMLHRLVDLCSTQTWTEAQRIGSAELHLTGTMLCAGRELPVRFEIAEGGDQAVRLNWSVLSNDIESESSVIPVATFLDFSVAADEAFFGLGVRSSSWNRRGERVLLSPNDPSEQSASHQLALTSSLRAFLFPRQEYALLDLRQDQSARLETWRTTEGSMTVVKGDSPSALIDSTANRIGYMTGLPLEVHSVAEVSGVIDEIFVADRPWLGLRSNSDLEALLTADMVRDVGPLETGWGPLRGLQGSLIRMLSGGVSGVTVSYSPVGGVEMAQQLWWQKPRTMELFLRWLELNTFTAWLRLSEGDEPTAHFQVGDSVAGEVHFDRLAQLYHALAPYREELMAEARELGWPVVRPLWFEYPDDPAAWRLPPDQFLLGSQLLVAPVMTSGATERRLYLPRGEWTHLWSGEVHESTGEFITLPAPIGEPLALMRQDMPYRAELMSVGVELGIGR